MARRKKLQTPDALLDQLLSVTQIGAAFEQGSLADHLKKAFAVRAPNAEMDHHLADDGDTGSSRIRWRSRSIEPDPASSGAVTDTKIELLNILIR